MRDDDACNAPRQHLAGDADVRDVLARHVAAEDDGPRLGRGIALHAHLVVADIRQRSQCRPQIFGAGIERNCAGGLAVEGQSEGSASHPSGETHGDGFACAFAHVERRVGQDEAEIPQFQQGVASQATADAVDPAAAAEDVVLAAACERVVAGLAEQDYAARCEQAGIQGVGAVATDQDRLFNPRQRIGLVHLPGKDHR